jgi:integrase/recombinase XerD
MENLTFDYQLDEFMLFCRSKQLREKTLSSYEQTLRLFERWCFEELKIERVDAVTESTVRRYITNLMERGKYSFYANDKKKEINFPDRRRDFRAPVSITTINNYIRNLRVFFNWLERDYLLQKNPMKKVQQLKKNRKAKDFISDEEFKKLIGHLDKSYFAEHRDLAMIMLMIDTGMRLGECSDLLVSDINLAKKTILLRAEITKGRKDRMVFFSSKTEGIIRRWIQFKDRYSESEYLFPTKHGGSISVSNFETNFKKYLRRAGLKETISPHCLRNNFAKRCLMNGMDVFTLSKILGHSSVRVTEEAYLDLTDDDMQKRYQIFSPVASIT